MNRQGRHVPARRKIRRRPLRWNAESDLNLADIGGKAGASTHIANVASPRRRPKAARHLDMAAARHAEARRGGRPLRWNAESDLNLADIGGKAGASTHIANVAS